MAEEKQTWNICEKREECEKELYNLRQQAIKRPLILALTISIIALISSFFYLPVIVPLFFIVCALVFRVASNLNKTVLSCFINGRYLIAGFIASVGLALMSVIIILGKIL